MEDMDSQKQKKKEKKDALSTQRKGRHFQDMKGSIKRLIGLNYTVTPV